MLVLSSQQVWHSQGLFKTVTLNLELMAMPPSERGTTMQEAEDAITS